MSLHLETPNLRLGHNLRETKHKYLGRVPVCVLCRKSIEVGWMHSSETTHQLTRLAAFRTRLYYGAGPEG